MKKIFFMLYALCAINAFAFRPPVDGNDEVVVKINGFDEDTSTNILKVAKYDASKPFEFEIELENKTDKAISGVLEVWMNDDWKKIEPQKETLTLTPKSKKIVKRRAEAIKERVFAALYPLHVTFKAEGKDALHPIAIFETVGVKTPVPENTSPLNGVEENKNPPSAEALAKSYSVLEKIAREKARDALNNGCDPTNGKYRLKSRGEVFGAGYVCGKNGLFDGVLVFTDGNKELVWHGFKCEVDERAIGAEAKSIACESVKESVNKNSSEVIHYVKTRGGKDTIPLRAQISAQEGALEIKWDMPGVKRDKRGYPRYTMLSLGNGTLPVWRAYMGFGNVIVKPKKFKAYTTGFDSCARHIGGDYENGLSLVQAVDVHPKEVKCDCKVNYYSIVGNHDTTFKFVPSARGAFAAAKKFSDVSGYKKGAGVDSLLGKVCFDNWYGDYLKEAWYLREAAKYGLTDSVFVRHMWQRWEYDYRLPEIWPPIGDYEKFQEMCKAARETGIILSLHDNYIDYYPDAEDYSYGKIIFNANGTPQKAWYNRGLRAQSYRWAPHAFMPYLERNAALIRQHTSVDSIFIDVFSANAPMDYYDRDGKFYPRTVTQREWGRAFDVYREKLGNKNGITISEAGHDSLIGHLDGGQADHFAAQRLVGPNYEDAERTPWHDIVTHGKFVLLGGGLGPRYCAVSWTQGGDNKNHGWASDDYLSNLIIGGRAPMCNGPFNRNAVMTYWLLHDVAAKLAKAEFESLEYVGENIHRQHSVFSDGGEVWSNRETNSVWNVQGWTLPTYGFYAKAKGVEAGIIRKGDHTVAFSQAKGCLFVDARGKMTDFENGIKTDGSFRLTLNDWRFTPLPWGKRFTAELDLNKLGVKGAEVLAIELIDPEKAAKQVKWTQEGDVVRINADSYSFSYQIKFKKRETQSRTL